MVRTKSVCRGTNKDKGKRKLDDEDKVLEVIHVQPYVMKWPNEFGREKYDNYIKHRRVATERPIDIATLEKTCIPQLLESRGWSSICTVEKGAACEIVREWYSHMRVVKINGERTLSSVVRSKEVNISVRRIASFKGIRRDLNAELPRKKNYVWPSSDVISFELCTENGIMRHDVMGKKVIEQGKLNEKYRLLNMIYSFNIHPRMHWNTIGPERAKMIYAIGTGITIDLPRYIFDVIREASTSHSVTDILPFGSLITTLCAMEDIHPDATEQVTEIMGPINGATLKKSGSHSGKKNVNLVVPSPDIVPPPAYWSVLVKEVKKIRREVNFRLSNIELHLGIEKEAAGDVEEEESSSF